eukprot:CAMPEP_0201513828 /NCGR_PEP_ID=MMETSP0161_2-20130828/5804_1 /ASSEMBLY_ACC=CAM_ASM_000251 /TAXON_ID=180227 /ORGANISM="Neoparamoeba aestuarina, Strain SoJaBio B1-5/56/2" /LENGTH=499 /DNA_ID=CAMNT_0047910195 /DNA_START=163 /DNA_END=1662 /DNA_ORIENTATION=-
MTAEDDVEMNILTRFSVFLMYAILVVYGYMSEMLDNIMGRSTTEAIQKEGYAPALSRIETFFVRRLYARMCNCFNRPIASNPGAYVDVIDRDRLGNGEGERVFSRRFALTDRKIKCMNLASYNYLGFSENEGPVNDSVVKAVGETGLSQCGARFTSGNLSLHAQLEEAVARFTGKEAALVWGMGWGVNATGISCFAGRGSLLISDGLNHASLVVGCRASGGVVRVFKHNDVKDLERVLRNAIVEGQPLTRRPWKKIVIIIEGTYSMEGEFPPLKEIVELKKKYKCYLYVDEAHSIGAVGDHGRGIAEHCGIPPEDIDIFMGTFTKSFGAAGGYMASSKEVVNYVRATTFAMYYDNGMPPPVAQQTLTALKIIAGEDGTDDGVRRIKQLKDNARYFRAKLKELNFQIIGDNSCPIVPLMIFHPVKLMHFSELCLEKKLAVAVVSFPATPLTLGRARFCLSSAHSREDIDKVLEALDEIGDHLFLKYNRSGWDSLRALLWD